ncbi:hypothetical protein ACSSS7_007958 [Eimeria intestinalis]
MAADSSLLELEGFVRDSSASPAAAAATAACCLNLTSSPNSGCNSSSSNSSSNNISNGSSRDDGSRVSSQKAAREAALAAAAQAASLSDRCRSLLPLLKKSAASPSSINQQGNAHEKHPNPTSKTSNSGRSSSVVTKGDVVPQAAEFLELESDGEGPMIELEVGVGVLDVKGQVPDDTRLAEMGVHVVDLPEDSPVLQNTAPAASSQLDALQRALAARRASNCGGERPLVSVLSSGSSSEDEGKSDVEPED